MDVSSNSLPDINRIEDTMRRESKRSQQDAEQRVNHLEKNRPQYYLRPTGHLLVVLVITWHLPYLQHVV